MLRLSFKREGQYGMNSVMDDQIGEEILRTRSASVTLVWEDVTLIQDRLIAGGNYLGR